MFLVISKYPEPDSFYLSTHPTNFSNLWNFGKVPNQLAEIRLEVLFRLKKRLHTPPRFRNFAHSLKTYPARVDCLFLEELYLPVFRQTQKF
jgi:hypothetical protein